MSKIKRPKKAINRQVTKEFLQHREKYAVFLGYKKQKWVEFCEEFLSRGYNIELYEAQRTVSKYVSVIRGDKRFKVRFSNHKPINARELRGDCDCFVGITNLKTITSTMAIAKTLDFFGDI